MAELAVGTALLSIEIIYPVLKQHLNLKKNIKHEIESFQEWLRAMKAFLEDNEDRAERRRWPHHKVEQVRGIAYDIEDVLEEYSLHSTYIFHSNKFTQKVFQVSHNIKHHFPLHGISGKITSIKKKIGDIGLQDYIFDNRPAASSSGTRTRIQASPLLLDELIGYEKPREEFTSQLIDGEKGLVKIVVVGPVGSGKSTFVKRVFGERRILGQFDCHAWVHVSLHFDVEELLSDMLKKFCESRKEIYRDQEDADTLTKLRNYLVAKRYIVVLDNIWRREDWERIKDAFPNDQFLVSRIILTTMASDVASSAQFIHLNGLEAQEAWTLFCKKAFQDSNGKCPPELEDCSAKILKRCEGLPFFILAVGGALSNTPKFPREWEKFHSSIGAEINRNSPLSVITSTLLNGYEDLSGNLKSCLLYFSIFPEDYSVGRGRLVRLWVAERFATETHAKTAEEVAEDYLNELIQRNLVHVSSWGFDGQPRYCRVLNLVRAFVVQKCKEENFVSIFSEEHNIPGHKPRRLSVQSACTYSSQNSDFSGVRSMSLFRCDNTSLSEIENSFRLLRVLDFHGVSVMP